MYLKCIKIILLSKKKQKVYFKCGELYLREKETKHKLHCIYIYASNKCYNIKSKEKQGLILDNANLCSSLDSK